MMENPQSIQQQWDRFYPPTNAPTQRPPRGPDAVASQTTMQSAEEVGANAASLPGLAAPAAVDSELMDARPCRYQLFRQPSQIGVNIWVA